MHSGIAKESQMRTMDAKVCAILNASPEQEPLQIDNVPVCANVLNRAKNKGFLEAPRFDLAAVPEGRSKVLLLTYKLVPSPPSG